MWPAAEVVIPEPKRLSFAKAGKGKTGPHVIANMESRVGDGAGGDTRGVHARDTHDRVRKQLGEHPLPSATRHQLCSQTASNTELLRIFICMAQRHWETKGNMSSVPLSHTERQKTRSLFSHAGGWLWVEWYTKSIAQRPWESNSVQISVYLPDANMSNSQQFASALKLSAAWSQHLFCNLKHRELACTAQ